MRKAIQEAVLTEGNQTFPLEHISEGVFSCYGSRNHTPYRATITGTDRLNADKITFYVNKWVESTAVTQVLHYIVFFDENCSAYLSAMSERECD